MRTASSTAFLSTDHEVHWLRTSFWLIPVVDHFVSFRLAETASISLSRFSIMTESMAVRGAHFVGIDVGKLAN